MLKFVYDNKKDNKTRSSTVVMITQSISEKNGTNERNEVLSKLFHDIPVVMTTGKNGLYFLIKDLDTALEDFISTGKAYTNEFHVFSNDDMQAMTVEWEKLGMTVAYRSQAMEYMDRNVTIIYPQIIDKTTGKKISLIPWFMLPGRPFPLFVYLYALWHYEVSLERSQRLTAAATSKLFGIRKFDKSTVCRNIKAMAMGHLLGKINHERPLSIAERESLSIKDLIGCIPKMIENYPPIETFQEKSSAQHIETINNTENVRYALSSVPSECSKVIKEKPSIRSKPCDVRKRPGRPRTKATQRGERKPEFVKSHQMEAIRKDFITICRNIVMDAAVTYHRTLM